MKKSVKQSTLTILLNSISILLMALAIILFTMVMGINKDVLQANTDRYALTQNAKRFMNGSAYLTGQVRSYAATGIQEYYDNYWNEVETLKNRDISLANMKEIGLTTDEQAWIEEMANISNTLVDLEDEAMQLTAKGETDIAIEAVFGNSYNTEIEKIAILQTKFLESLDARTGNTINTLTTRINFVATMAYICLFATISIQIFSTFIIHFKVIRPIQTVSKEMQLLAEGNLSSTIVLSENTSEIGMLNYSLNKTRKELLRYIQDIDVKIGAMAKGDLTVSVDLEYIGDFASIKESILLITQSLNDALGNIENASSQINSGSNQLASGAQNLAQGATEQSSAVEELSATINDISGQVSHTAQVAKEASNLANETGIDIRNSDEKMKEMIGAMNKIRHMSEEIEKIVKTINDIAFQTNILALNAAVEAARAGNAGKGFAVVADEVRNLASKSADAANETSALIEQSTQAVNQGAAIAQETAQSMGKVMDFSTAVVDQLDQISQASQSESEAIMQITQGIEQIASVVQMNSATAQQSAASAQELAAQSGILNSLVARFTLHKSHPHASLPPTNF